MTPQEEAQLLATHLIAPPAVNVSEDASPAVKDAYRMAAEDFIRAGGVVTLREWCLMPAVVRDAFLGAREALVAQVVESMAEQNARRALEAMGRG